MPASVKLPPHLPSHADIHKVKWTQKSTTKWASSVGALTNAITQGALRDKTFLQVCLATQLAHLGSWVPAKSMELTPVDAIFVRMGARDSIVQGQVSKLYSVSVLITHVVITKEKDIKGPHLLCL